MFMEYRFFLVGKSVGAWCWALNFI